MKELKEKLEERDNFKAVIDYGLRKGKVSLSIDSMEKYYMVETDHGFDYVEELPEGKEWTSDGSCSVDINAYYFPDLKTKKGWKTLAQATKRWIKESREESFMWKYPPFPKKWANWVFVLDSWEAVRHEMIQEILRKRKDYKTEDWDIEKQKISKEDVLKHLADEEHYHKLNEKFHYTESDPTCIISIEDHDLRDGYSHKKCVSLMNEWLKVAYPTEKEIKFVLKE